MRRALPAIEEIFSGMNNDVMLFTHGTLMRLIVCQLLGIEINEYRRIFPNVPNTGRISLSVSSNEVGRSGVRTSGLLAFER